MDPWALNGHGAGCGQDSLEWSKIRGFAPVAFAFLGVIFANIKTLQYANVETFIVRRTRQSPTYSCARPVMPAAAAAGGGAQPHVSPS